MANRGITDRIREMMGQGKTNREIADELQDSSARGRVGILHLCYMVRSGRAPSGEVRIRLKAYQLEFLREEARARDMTIPDIVSKIIGTVADDNLFDAVIGDEK